VHSVEGLPGAAIVTRAGQVKLEAASGHAAYLHPGDNPGYQSLVVWLPGQAACVAVLANDEAADTEALLRHLVPVALDAAE
jgi:hypothetical protein